MIFQTKSQKPAEIRCRKFKHSRKVTAQSALEFQSLFEGRLCHREILFNCRDQYTVEELDEIPKEEKDAQPLCLKLEALLVRFMNTVVPYSTVMKYYNTPKDSCFSRAGKILEYEEWSAF